MAPSLDQELVEFIVCLTLRQSDTLHALNYSAFLEIFDEDYLIGKSPHEDNQDYEASSESSEEEAHRVVSNQQEEQPELVEDENDLMLTVDATLELMVSKLNTEQNTMKSLFKAVKGYLNS